MAKRLKPYIFSDWPNMEKLVPTQQKVKYLAFRSRYEAYLRRVRSLPEEPPQIDWDAYKSLVADEGTVDKIKSSYETFQVPFPKDTQTQLVEEQWKSLEPEIKAFCERVQKDIDEAQKELTRIKKLPSFSDMTMEMFREAYPDEALDPINRPTFWPHTPEDQLGHKVTEEELYSHSDK